MDAKLFHQPDRCYKDISTLLSLSVEVGRLMGDSSPKTPGREASVLLEYPTLEHLPSVCRT